MRFSPLVPLLFAMLGCDSGTQPTRPSADSAGSQAQPQKVATPEKQAVKLPAVKFAAAAVKKHMTTAQLALGDPIVNLATAGREGALGNILGGGKSVIYVWDATPVEAKK